MLFVWLWLCCVSVSCKYLRMNERDGEIRMDIDSVSCRRLIYIYGQTPKISPYLLFDTQ